MRRVNAQDVTAYLIGKPKPYSRESYLTQRAGLKLQILNNRFVLRLDPRDSPESQAKRRVFNGKTITAVHAHLIHRIGHLREFGHVWHATAR